MYIIHNYRKYMYRLIKQLAYEKNVRCRITYATVVGGFSSFTWAILCLACRPRGIFPNLYIYCRYVLLFKQRTRHTHPWQIAIANLDASKTVELRSSNCHEQPGSPAETAWKASVWKPRCSHCVSVCSFASLDGFILVRSFLFFLSN